MKNIGKLAACGCSFMGTMDLGDGPVEACFRHHETEPMPEDEVRERLKGREASCIYCGHLAESDPGLAFFESRPEQKHDRHYCGCKGWD